MTPLNVSRLWLKKRFAWFCRINTNCASRLFCFTITGMMAASFVNNFSNGRGGLARIVPALNAPQVGLAAVILFSLSNVFLNRLSSKREKFQVNFVRPL